MLADGLKIIVFILIMIGFSYLISNIAKIKSYYVPITSITCISLILYFCGLFDFLFVGVWLITIPGFIGFFLLIKNYKNIKYCTSFINYFNIFFIVISVSFLLSLLHTKFQHYDNFSHWATVVKYILLNNRFPDMQASIIEFTNYPLGTASWIYFICLFCGHSQGVMLFGQGLIIFSAFYAMFGMIEEKKRFMLYAFMAMGLSLLSIVNITIRINNLLVDFILPLLVLTSFSLIYCYRKELKKTIFPLTMILGFLTIVKSTGIIFALVALLYYVYVLSKEKEKKRIIRVTYGLLVSLLSIVPIAAWNIYQKIVFAGVVTKFDLSSQQMSTVQKTSQQIKEIMQLFIKEVFNIQTRAVIIFLLFECLAILACILVRIYLKKKWNLEKVLIYLNIMVVLYYCGILAMYIFSMPLDEAIYLAGFDRYSSSIIVLFCGAIVLCATIDIQESFYIKIGVVADYKSFKSIETKKIYQTAVIAFTVVCLLFLISEYNGMKYNDQQIANSTLERIEKVTGDHWPDNGKIDTNKYLIYGSDRDGHLTNYYMQYVARYFLFADHVDGICMFYEDNLLNLLNQYDYLVIVDSDKDEKQLLDKYFNVDGKEGIYKISDLLNNVKTDASTNS